MKGRAARRGKKREVYPPLRIEPVACLKGADFDLAVPSAQVKSAILLAALYARGKTSIKEFHKTRDHTERLLSLFGADITVKARKIVCCPCTGLRSPGRLFVPSDFSSASFFIVLGLLLKNSELVIKGVNINPTRCGLLRVLKRMGAKIRILNRKGGYESSADIIIKSSSLKSTDVCEEEIPLMIDEIPILCVAASFAEGRTLIKGVKELKIKETDRISSMVYNLKKAGINIKASKYKEKEGRKGNWFLSIEGGGGFKEAAFKSFSDHRTAMSMMIFGSAAGPGYSIDELGCLNKSFSEFIDLIESLKS
ncbi:MAG: hypothetical protein GF375_05400 [Candidatus Omnitrophica bacterium]|nr:hypothetical protein [Candidatus Omnitrophota bacterium]MBD3269421.1 hypothetical protein [Candidatus Omnitrophota bacterium]